MSSAPNALRESASLHHMVPRPHRYHNKRRPHIFVNASIFNPSCIARRSICKKTTRWFVPSRCCRPPDDVTPAKSTHWNVFGAATWSKMFKVLVVLCVLRASINQRTGGPAAALCYEKWRVNEPQVLADECMNEHYFWLNESIPWKWFPPHESVYKV